MYRLSVLWFLLLLLVTSFPVTSVAATKRRCTIKQLVGSVKVRKGTSASWVDARPKLPLKEDDALRTLIESEAELETTEGTVIKVGENTTIEISKLYGDAEQQKTSVTILNGAVLANVKKIMTTKSTFNFETPTATAAIRGTVVGFEVNKEKTIIKVYEGKIWVVPRGTKRGSEVLSNQMGIVSKGVKAVTIEKLNEKIPMVLSPSGSDSLVGADSLQIQTEQSDDSLKSDTIGVIDSSAVTDTAGQSLDQEAFGKQKLTFTVTSPSEGMDVKKPFVPVSGTVTPGAEVTVMSIKLPVAANGQFSGQIPLANEIGSYDLEFEASLNGVSQKVYRRINYKPEYRFIVTAPTDRQVITSTLLTVKGEVVPPKAEVTVMGRRLSVASDGHFSGIITIPDEEGEVLLDFEINASGEQRSETRTVFYKRPPDTYRPQLSVSTAKQCWSVTVFDRTVDEEITLHYSIDNVQDFKQLRPNESTCIPFEEGVHSYTVYAKDKSGNLSNTEVLRSYSFLATTTWYVKMRKPSGSISIDLPPASPASETSLYSVEFTIENLPDDNMKLIREVTVTNKTNGKKVTVRTFTDNFIEADMELVRGGVNQIQIDVNDINNITKNHVFQIVVR